ncbi:MAG: sodium:solute symporter [Cyanobium sp.]
MLPPILPALTAVPGALPPELWSWTEALLLLALLLTVGTGLGRLLGTHQWGIPEALLAGGLGLVLAPAGALPLLPPAVIQVWDQLPLILLTLVFASLLIGKPLPAVGGLWRPLSAQMLLALTLAFGQYLVAALAVLLVLQPLLGAPAVMACLIEVAYEGGHGSAAAMGPTYARLGLESGEALGLALATVGLLASTLVGGVLVLLGRRQGWILNAATQAASPAARPATAQRSLALGADANDDRAAAEEAGATDRETNPGSVGWSVAPAEPIGPESGPPSAGPSFRPASEPTGGSRSGAAPPPRDGPTPARVALNLALTGSAVLIGVLLLEGLRLLADWQGGLLQMVVEALPVFPLALLGSLLMRLVLERMGTSSVVLPKLQGRIGTLSADLLITAATACLDLSLLARDWLPLTVLATLGLIWNLVVILLLAPRILPASWFERALVEFGQATGVAASGLLLLNMVDPDDRNGSLTPFSIKQLLLQPFLAGGVITVVAPLAVDGWGLPIWSGVCLALVVLWISLGLWLARSAPTTGG